MKKHTKKGGEGREKSDGEAESESWRRTDTLKQMEAIGGEWSITVINNPVTS